MDIKDDTEELKAQLHAIREDKSADYIFVIKSAKRTKLNNDL